MSLSLRETTSICRELTGNEVPIEPADADRPGDVPLYLSDCGRLFGVTAWRPQRDPGGILADIHAWITANEDAVAASLGLRPMKLSVVMPAHNEAGSIEQTVLTAIEPSRPRIERGPRGRDASIDQTIAVVDARSRDPQVRYLRSHNPPGFGYAMRSGLDPFQADAVVLVMADGSDDPDDLVRYLGVIEQGYDCAFGSRFVPSPRWTTTRAQARVEPGRELVHPHPVPPRLQRHDERVQGVSPRGDRDGAAALLPSLQSHGQLP